MFEARIIPAAISAKFFFDLADTLLLFRVPCIAVICGFSSYLWVAAEVTVNHLAAVAGVNHRSLLTQVLAIVVRVGVELESLVNLHGSGEIFHTVRIGMLMSHYHLLIQTYHSHFTGADLKHETTLNYFDRRKLLVNYFE